MWYTQGGVDVRDAASSTFVTEVAVTLKDLQALCGNEFSAYVRSTAMPATDLPSSTQVGPYKPESLEIVIDLMESPFPCSLSMWYIFEQAANYFWLVE